MSNKEWELLAFLYNKAHAKKNKKKLKSKEIRKKRTVTINKKIVLYVKNTKQIL